MKVLHIVNISFVLPYFIGDQFDYLHSKGFKVFVACTPSDHLFKYAEEKKFILVKINVLRQISLVEDFKAIRTLIKLIKSEGIEIVIGHTPKGALLGMLASYIANVNKRIYARHGLMYETATGFKRLLLKNIERFTGFLATTVICDSNSVMEVSNLEKLSSASKNIILNKGTCNGIDSQKSYNRASLNFEEISVLRKKHDIRDSDKVIGYVGRLVNDKGINELVLAWKILLKTRKDIKLLLVGPFEDRDTLSKELKEFITNEASIIHTGLVNDVNLYYGLMDMFVLPSYREGFPTVVLEASSMELPVITTDVTGCKDAILPDVTGVFTEINPDSISEKISYYLDNEDIAKMHGKNGRKFIVENFDQLAIWEEISRVIS